MGFPGGPRGIGGSGSAIPFGGIDGEPPPDLKQPTTGGGLPPAVDSFDRGNPAVLNDRFGGPVAAPANTSVPPPPPPKSEGMPDPREVTFYRKLPNGGGEEVGKWFGRVRDNLKPYVEKREKLGQAKDVYGATVAKESADIQKAMKKDMPKGVQEFNRRTGGAAFDLIEKYQTERQLTKEAADKLGTAYKKADGAQERVVAAEKKIEEQELRIRRGEVVEKQGDVKGQIEEREKLIEKVTDLAGKAASLDFKGMAEVGVKELATLAATSELKQELGRLDAQIKHIDEKLKVVKDDGLKAELLAAKIDLIVAFREIKSATLEHNRHATAAQYNLDKLVRLEKDKGPTTVFCAIGDFYAQTATVGRELYDRTRDYTQFLEKSPMASAGQMAERVRDHQELVKRQGADLDGTWNNVADQTRNYLENVDKWQKAEVQQHKDVLGALRRGEQFEIADIAMEAAAKDLGKTASPGEVIPQN